MLYKKMTRCLRCRIAMEGDFPQPKEKAVRPNLRRATSGADMNTLFQAEESSLSTGKKVVIAIVALALLGLGVWGGVEIAWRLASGR